MNSSVTIADTSPRMTARIAGVLYLLIIVFGISSEVFVRASLVAAGDAAATINNIMASDSLYRAGFVFDSIMLFSDVAIAVLFYVLLKPVNQTLALASAVFRLIQAAILAANLLNYHAVLLLLNGNGVSVESETVQSRVMLLLGMHAHGYDLGLMFFAISNFILGYLLIKSKLFPAILGYGLQAAATVYLIGSYTRFMAPDFMLFIEPMYVIPLVAELSFCLWLLVKGIKTDRKMGV